MCFNCRCCGRPEAVREFRNIAELYHPKVLFVSETKMGATKGAAELRGRPGYQKVFAVNCVGRGGGLALLWKNDVVVDLKSYSRSHIDVWITETGDGNRQWRFPGFYGDPSRSRRKESWWLLRFLRNASNLPWLCGGDFNEILHDYEQISGQDREEWKMEGFREVVEECGFTDLGFSGLWYTWDNRREGRSNIKVRLDRCLADEGMLDLFANSSVLHVQTTESDHCALLIKLCRFDVLGNRGHGKRFRYENTWQRHESYEHTVAAAWAGGGVTRMLIDIQPWHGCRAR
jgi:exonuclease III